MKTIRVYISDDALVSSCIGEMDRQIPDAARRMPDFKMLYDQVTICIDDFVSKAKKLARSGTTIYIEKEFNFADISVLVILEYPKKMRLIDRIKGIFKRG